MRNGPEKRTTEKGPDKAVPGIGNGFAERSGGSSPPSIKARAPRAFEKVERAIRDMLEKGTLQAGNRLPTERDLAEQFGVGRHSIREALRSLENSGLIASKKGPGGGAFILEGGSDVVRSGFADLLLLGTVKSEHLSEARIVIGSAVARLACERRTREDLILIRRNIEDAELAVEAGDVPRRLQINFDFHRLLARATRNPVLCILTDAVIEINKTLAEAAGPAEVKKALGVRRRILDALERRDADTASKEMTAHLSRLQRLYNLKPK